jgi:hypothetical protein
LTAVPATASLLCAITVLINILDGNENEQKNDNTKDTLFSFKVSSCRYFYYEYNIHLFYIILH